MISCVKEINGPFPIDEVGMVIQFNVDGAPPDVADAVGMFYKPLVGRAAPRFITGSDGDRPTVYDGGRFLSDDMLVKLCRGEVAVYRIHMYPGIFE